MIHPNTELRFINDEIGYGVFATEFIPKGTILYVKDDLEIEITKNKYHRMDESYRAIIDKYSYIDERGIMIVSWDHAKYINHKCECNSMSTSYGFEIAISDIAINDEITDEYGLFNLAEPIEINCKCNNCRKILLPTDIDQYYAAWDILIQDALEHIYHVKQPLWSVMDSATRTDLMAFLSCQNEYRSVKHLKYVKRSAVKGKKYLTNRAA